MNIKKIIILILFIILAIVCSIYFLFFREISVNPDKSIILFDENNIDDSFASLDYFILQPDQHQIAAAEATKYLQDEDKKTRFAAIYLLGNTGTVNNKVDLEIVLEDEDEILQIIAASYLIGWGEKRALPILIQALDSQEYLYFSDPPTVVAELVKTQLPLFTEVDFGEDKILWENWWKENENDLSWDVQNKIYK